MDSGYGIGWFIGYTGDILFRYIPATLTVLSGNAPDFGIQNPIVMPVTQPVTTDQLLNFLQATAQSGALEQLYRAWSINANHPYHRE